jgi:hypothetical protein
MQPAEQDHLDEIAAILAVGLMRLQARKSSQISPSAGESSLHFSAPESGDPTRLGRENRE